MPAKNPRLTITLQPSVHALLRRLSDLTDKSQSSLVAELLEQSAPVFERMVKVLEAAHAAKDSLRTSMVESLERAQTKLEGQLGLALETIDDGCRPVLEAAEAVTRRAARSPGGRLAGRRGGAGGAAATPVPVTRGSGVPGKARKGGKSGGL